MIELSPATTQQLDRLIDAIETLAAVCHQTTTQAKRLADAMSEFDPNATPEVDVEDETVLECCDCERAFIAGTEIVVRSPGGDIRCVACYDKSREKEAPTINFKGVVGKLRR